MEITYIAQVDPGVFTAVILTDNNIEATNTALSNQPRPLTPSDAEKDARIQFFTGDRDFFILGAGPAGGLKVEAFRNLIHAAVNKANELKKTTLQIVFLASEDTLDPEYFTIALGEVPVLSNYRFKKYVKDPKPRTLANVAVYTNLASAELLLRFGRQTAECACIARDLVNEPPNVIHAVSLAEAAQELGREHGFDVQVLGRAEIEAHGMGGLLTVNKGSMLPPTFTIMNYKPANARNTKPIVLVGKGVTFDSGGLSMKPPELMVGMKGDMAGGAAVICTLASVARNQLPYHVIGLVPATDNRPGYNAYTPNDVVRMMDGTHVEVLNTDAEGRMILADALSWAKQYDAAIVIDVATLTGSAVIAVGEIASVLYSTADETATRRLLAAADITHERLVHFPLWEEYFDGIKSDIADLKNVGGREAGSITAAKFLQHFTHGAYPWIHLDIAGPAMLSAAQTYRPKGGTGVGVRLLTEFIRRFGD